jgi:hypothetical protein
METERTNFMCRGVVLKLYTICKICVVNSASWRVGNVLSVRSRSTVYLLPTSVAHLRVGHEQEIFTIIFALKAIQDRV